ncbi:uncharacterized protein [Penaeus vannamei]|uniref:uncharacterized protein n=1 Tax=Penaeus vannamei TaxID=6689 RepID=UPI00387F7C6C
MEKAETLALHFAEKMTVLARESPAPILLQRTRKKLNFLNIQVSNVQRILEKLNANKATGPVGVSTHLRTCAAEIASPRTPILTECFSKTSRPSIWKSTKIVPVHKKDSTSKPNNYRPIPLLLAIENVFERDNRSRRVVQWIRHQGHYQVIALGISGAFNTQIPEAAAYADDLAIHLSFSKDNANTSGSRLQRIIDIVSNWGSCWKINFAAEKSQSLIISRSRDRITRNKALFMQERLLQEILHLLSPEGALQLYKSQVRSALEYSSLAWNGAAQTHLSLLDKIQDRAVTLMGRTANVADINVDDLQRRRDVAGLTVLYKAQHLDVPHLAPLKQQPRRSARRTRATQQIPAALSPPTASTSHFQRHFICRYVNLWNDINSDNDIPFSYSIQTFKNFEYVFTRNSQIYQYKRALQELLGSTLS